MQSHEDQIATAKRHVREGEARVRRQHEIIAEMDRDGHSDAAAVARDLLKTLENTLALMRADLARLTTPA